MSRSSAGFGASFVLLALGTLAVPAACSSGDHPCLRMSDCEAPFECVEGTCRSDEALGGPSDGAADPDAAASDQ